MTKQLIRARIEEIGVIPSVRLSSTSDALFAAEEVSQSGLHIVEVTMTVPGAIDIIRELARNNPDLIVGAGTVFSVETARQCVDAGAKYLTSTGLSLPVVEFALKEGILVLPGALTPTEIAAAWHSGADFVKVFPCSTMGGASYIRTLKQPFPDVPLIASGGVNQANTADFILSGAIAVGIGRDLVQPAAIERRERGWIRELARRYMRIVQDARKQLRGGAAGLS